LYGTGQVRQSLERALAGIRDLERLVNRAALGRATPRELGAIRDSLQGMSALRLVLQGLTAAALRLPGRQLRSEPELEDLLLRALEQTLPQNLHDGAVVRPGFDPRLDELRAGISDAQRWISDLERQEREATGIKSLKVGFNRVFGYYLEVSNASAIAPPPSYQRKQTLAGAERYVTAELK